MIPTLQQTEQTLAEAEMLNPGPWVAHSRYVAQAARLIGAHLPGIEPGRAYIFGLLHDIGRRVGPTDMRHVLDGYHFLAGLGFEEPARICLTHSFPLPGPYYGSGLWDCTPAEFAFVQRALLAREYTDYDRLLQLCDALALPSGFCLIEKRLLDVTLRHGFNEFTLAKWQAFFHIQQDFERVMNISIYQLLPGVVENTFNARIG